MTLLISYTNYYGAHVFFLPGAHSMLKPALHIGVSIYGYLNNIMRSRLVISLDYEMHMVLYPHYTYVYM